ncbi:hypothetical protein [uncultured Kiloniella sp.]|uniref:hypothetical protein n=1 Tax=Kiloniella sp. TaxID=1938587 RepID=UPI0026243BB1|nr:hypothetical protein [uncultured Kiloniella sp.]
MFNNVAHMATRAAHTAKSLRRAFAAARPVATTTWTTITTTPVKTMKVKMGGSR